MKKLISTSAVVLSFASSAQAAVIANLFDDYTNATSGGVTDGTAFTENGWTFAQEGDGALGYINDNTADTDDDFGNRDASGYGGSGVIFTTLTSVPAVSNEGLFSATQPGANRLAFHPGGSSDDLIITWTADQDYQGVTVDFSLERANASSGNLGFTIGGTATTTDNDFDRVVFNRFGDADPDAIFDGQLTLGDISAGETIIFTLDDNGNASGDEHFGNFTISTVPEPSSTALLGLGGLALILRRRK